MLGAGPSLLVANVQTMDRQIDLTLLKERLVTMLSAAFGGLALLLACVGLVWHPRLCRCAPHERAWGPHGIGRDQGRDDVAGAARRLVVADDGIAIGVPAMLTLARVVRGLLYRVEPFDPSHWA